MNRFLNYLLSMTMIASLLVVTSCGEDPDAIDETLNPTLEIAGDDADQLSFDVGDTINLTFNFNTPRELSSFNYTITVDGVEQSPVFLNPETDLGLTANETAGSIDFDFPVPEGLEGSTVSIMFEVVDQENVSAEAVYDFTVNEENVVSYNAVLLAAPTNDEPNSQSETFFSTENGERYSVQEVNQSSETLSATVDFGYFYGSGSADTRATLASPAAYPFQALNGFDNWTVKNATLIKPTTMTQSEFIEQGEDAEFIRNLFESSDFSTNENATEGRVNRLNEGDVLVFMTAPEKEGGSEFGLILVNEITGTDTSTSSISISVKVTE